MASTLGSSSISGTPVLTVPPSNITSVSSGMVPSSSGIKREIHEACWELLYIELLDSLTQKSSSEDPTTLDHATTVKLEKMGFQVGQRLAER
jgi:hypothetical protein